MMASKIFVSLQERKDLERYIRFFFCKVAQIIIQSRLGSRASSKCKVISSGSEWFNISVKDVQEIVEATRHCLTEIHTLSAFTANVEIFLTTKEGQKMVLEVWSTTMDVSCRDSVKISYTVYNRLARLLRSLVCVTRNEQGYRLSRTQSSDTFVICYRIYHGPTDISQLGSSTADAKLVDMGSVVTPLGTVRLTAHCRSELLFSPTNSFQDLDLKENYFTTESPTANGRPVPPLGNSSNRHLNSQEWSEEDAVDGRRSSASTPPTDYELLHYPPNSARKNQAKQNGSSSKESSKDKIFRLGNTSSDTTDSSGSAQPNRSPDKIRRPCGFAFAPRRASQISLEEEVPFSLLMEQAERNGDSDTLFPPHSPDSSTEGRAFSTSLFDDPEFMEQYMKPADDFVLVDVKTPFAAPDAEDDIGRFYKKFHKKQDLVLLHSGETISDTLQHLNLDDFEKEMEDFDHFCDQLNISTNHQGSPV